jgi:hypothetical protein
MSMAARGRGRAESRISPALARALSEGDGGYELSSAFAGPEARRFHGEWEVVEHLVDGEGFLERFRARSARALRAEGASYRATYSFLEGLCAKRVCVDGVVDLPSGEIGFAHRMGVAISWAILPGGYLRVRPELGYQATYLGGEPAAASELQASGTASVIRYSFEGEELLLEEGGDSKRLRRLP